MRQTPKTHTCFDCKTVLPAMETMQWKDHWYCSKCYQKRVDLDWFKRQIVTIFAEGTFSWPRMMRDRKKLQETYGYTDKTIIETLKYAIYEKRIESKSNSLYLVTPSMVDEMTAQRRLDEHIKKRLQDLMRDPDEKNGRIIVHYDDAEHPIHIPEQITSANSDWNDLLEGYDE